MTALGMASGWRNSSFSFTRSSVTPAMALNSPAESVVGIETCGIAGPAGGSRSASISSGVRMPLARHIRTAFAPSVSEPPPKVTMRSASTAQAASVASITSRRGVCGLMRSNWPATLLPSARRSFSISPVSRPSVPLTIRKMRSAPSRSASSAAACSSGAPKLTASIRPNATRPDFIESSPCSRRLEDRPEPSIWRPVPPSIMRWPPTGSQTARLTTGLPLRDTTRSDGAGRRELHERRGLRSGF